jgi:hypothetical protein
MEISYAAHRKLIFALSLSIALAAVSASSPGQTAPAKPDPQKSARQRAQPASQRPVRVIADLSQFQIDQPRRLSMNQIGAGSRGAASALTLCAPAAGTTSSPRPLFEWRTPDGATAAARVTFTLLNQDGDVIYENDITGTSLEYPADAPALEPGKTYSWKVSGGELSRLPDPVSVTILSQAEQDALHTSLTSASDPLARAQVYIKGGLWYDSVAALQAAIQAHPDRKDLPEQLTKLYQRVAPACVASSDGPR